MIWPCGAGWVLLSVCWLHQGSGSRAAAAGGTAFWFPGSDRPACCDDASCQERKKGRLIERNRNAVPHSLWPNGIVIFCCALNVGTYYTSKWIVVAVHSVALVAPSSCTTRGKSIIFRQFRETNACLRSQTAVYDFTSVSIAASGSLRQQVSPGRPPPKANCCFCAQCPPGIGLCPCSCASTCVEVSPNRVLAFPPD